MNFKLELERIKLEREKLEIERQRIQQTNSVDIYSSSSLSTPVIPASIDQNRPNSHNGAANENFEMFGTQFNVYQE